MPERSAFVGSWRLLPRPAAPRIDSRLSDVACAGRDNVWAVGAQQPKDGAFGPLILHFDGSAWAAVEPPATAAPTSLSAVIALPDGAAWAAGGFSAAGNSGYTIPLVTSARGGH
jgi:hypothetical protein